MGDLHSMTRDELYEEAQRLDIEGRSDMTKDELLAAVQGARNTEPAPGEEITDATGATGPAPTRPDSGAFDAAPAADQPVGGNAAQGTSSGEPAATT